MRISILGTDNGNAVLSVLVLIMILSSVFIGLVSRIGAMQRYADDYKAKVIRTIEETNREIRNNYDLH